jgi:lysophospholipase L1-like esterase
MILPKLLPGLAVFILGASLASAAAPVRILPVGDSLTDTFPGYRAPLFKQLAAAGYSVEFVGPKKNESKDGSLPAAALRHAGHGGFTIGPGPSVADGWTNGKGNIFDNVDAWLASQPDIVLLLIGTNEFFNIKDKQPGYSPNRDGGARLGALLDKIHAVSPKSKIIVSSILPVGWDAKFAKGINDALPGLVSTRPYTVFADLAKTTAFTKGDWSGDNLNPSQQGYDKMAAAWFAALKPVLDARR